jgi:hypothetical protein
VLGDGVVEHGRQSTLPDLLDEVAAHVLGAHPGEGRAVGPAAAQTDLDEVRTAGGTGLDQPPHRRPLAGEVPFDRLGGVGVGVEMDDVDPAPADGGRHGCRRGSGDGVVAPEHDREDAAPRDLHDALTDRGVRGLDEPVRTDRVAEVDDLELLEDLDPEVEVEGAGCAGERP